MYLNSEIIFVCFSQIEVWALLAIFRKKIVISTPVGFLSFVDPFEKTNR